VYESGGLQLHVVERADIEALRELHNSPDTLKYLTDPHPVTPAMQEAWFSRLGTNPANQRYVISDADGLVSFVRLSEIDHANQTAQVGLDVMEARRGQGLGRKSWELLLRYCFEELNCVTVWALVASFNVRALHLYESLGFARSGRIPEALFREGKHHDLVVITMRRGEWYHKRASKAGE
jgi:RimJ/RimL family protein N-acetyltransferase